MMKIFKFSRLNTAIYMFLVLSFNVPFNEAVAENKMGSDLYCETMTATFMQLTVEKAAKPIERDKIKITEEAILKFCKDAPSSTPRSLSSMTVKEIAVISCMGLAEGAYLAYKRGEPDEPFSKLAERRNFAATACINNPKKFQNDMILKGPDYVLIQNY